MATFTWLVCHPHKMCTTRYTDLYDTAKFINPHLFFQAFCCSLNHCEQRNEWAVNKFYGNVSMIHQSLMNRERPLLTMQPTSPLFQFFLQIKLQSKNKSCIDPSTFWVASISVWRPQILLNDPISSSERLSSEPVLQKRIEVLIIVWSANSQQIRL